MISIIKELCKNYTLLWFCTINAVKQKYAGHILGILWLFLMPIILLTIYCVIYIYIYKMKPIEFSQGKYVLYIFAGLVPFLAISESIATGVTSLTGNRSILKNISFPSAIFPTQSTIVAHLSMVVGLVFITTLDIYFDTVSTSYLALPLVILMQTLFILGINFFLCIFNILVRDIQNMISFAVMGIMLVSPIAYTESMVPQNLKFLVMINPFYYFFRCYQKIIALNEMPNSLDFGIITTIALVSFFIGSNLFFSLRKVFTDYV